MNSFLRDSRSLGLNQHIDISQSFGKKFGTENIGTISGVHVATPIFDYWALDTDSNIIVGCNDGLNIKMCKIRHNGENVPNSMRYINPNPLPNIRSQSDLIIAYTNATVNNTAGAYVFNKGPNFPNGTFSIGAGGLNGTGGAQGTVSVSSHYASSVGALDTVNNSVTREDRWQTHNEHGGADYGKNEWIKFDIGYSKRMNKYRLWARGGTSISDGIARAQLLPRDWRIEGSNDDLNWTTIDTRIGINNDDIAHTNNGGNLNDIPYHEYMIQNPDFYRYYRLFVVSTNSSVGINISELAYYEGTGGIWDYTYCIDLQLAFYRCGCLGINSNSSFKMDGCNFANLISSNGMRETFRESFGNSSYTNGNSYPNLSNNVSLRDWNIVGPSITGVSLISMFYNCKKFDGDLSNWRITNPSTMASMLRTQNNEFTGSFLSSWTVTSPAQIAYSMNSFLRDSRSLGLNQHIDISDFSNAGLFSYDPKGITFNGIASVIDVSSECKVACYVPCNSVTNPNNGDIGKGMWFDESTWIAVFGHEPLGDSLIGPVVVYRNSIRIYYGDLTIYENNGFWCEIHPAGIHSWGNQGKENGFWQIGDLIAPARNESLYPNIPNGILGNASRTIVATIKTTSTASNNAQFICGYGKWGINHQTFGVRLRNATTFGGNNSDKYTLGLCGYANDFYSNFQITTNVETTIAVSYNSVNNTVYFFKKEANSTTWIMDVVFDRHQSGVTDPLNTTLGKGFMIGGFPTTGDPANPFIGTIRHLKGFNFACIKIQDVQEKIGSWDYTYCIQIYDTHFIVVVVLELTQIRHLKWMDVNLQI